MTVEVATGVVLVVLVQLLLAVLLLRYGYAWGQVEAREAREARASREREGQR